MAEAQPRPITDVEARRRWQRVANLARMLGFHGRVEYRHEFRGTGGAQFRLAKRLQDDCLILDAKAFERDADPDDFSLEAIVAHERGHQLLFRHPVLRRVMATGVSTVSEEVMASLVGSTLASLSHRDQTHLHEKARFDATRGAADPDRMLALVDRMRAMLLKVLR